MPSEVAQRRLDQSSSLPLKIQWLVEKLSAVILVVASFLKVYYFLQTTVIGSLATLWIGGNVFVASVEFCLGMLLFERGDKVWVARLASGLFATFLLFSTLLYAYSQPSCPCFGAAQIDPTIVIAIDAAFTLLLIGSSFVPNTSSESISIKFAVIVAVSFLVVSMGLCVLAQRGGLFPSKNFDVSIKPIGIDRVSKFGPKEVYEVSMTVDNRSNQLIEMVGGGGTCGMIVTADFPLRIQPKETRQFKILVSRIPGIALPREYAFRIVTTNGALFGSFAISNS